MHCMKAVVSVPLPPEPEGLHMVPIGARRITFLVRLQWLERARQSLNMTITIKLIFKFGKKIRNLSAKTFQGVDHLWNQLLLVKKRQTQNITFGLDVCWCKNVTPQNTNTTNGLVKTKRKTAKRVRTRGSGVPCIALA